MRTFPGLFLAGSMIIPLLSFSACKTKLDNLVVDPEFNEKSVYQKPIAVVGVTNRVERGAASAAAQKFPSPAENNFALTLANALAKEDKKKQIAPGPQVQRALTPEAFDKVMREYSETRKLGKKSCDVVKDGIKQNVWAAFAAIDSNETSSGESETEEEDAKTKKKVRYKVLSSTRALKMEMSVYDLATCKEVWYGQHERSETVSEKFEQKSTGKVGTDILMKVADSALGLNPKAPPPPKTERIAADLFEAFAENLPIKKD